ncbi:GNAT family N-acetyltransferase [Jeotgalibaca ciconiae]|uniref:N-acetyltransferase n=1 Tax=Jeotgalibaca ciconiae TaxID=2496265 RepID=A0A3Q9BKS7_9LACT|nr:GNAT family N-acetyltransferase [Jeotgalibaca ciconiae]AZP03555.1 N-acetyltransferase [Jeotgalibaca ciconiae]HJB22908.1 GNAT family N-acetyltransferase [Candidatus Jeotgalibaca pullicola]
MIYYQEDKNIEMKKLIDLYKNAGWTAYTKSPEEIQLAIKNSLSVITAWEDEKLVGLIRSVGDSVSILYIQDILVLKDYQNTGIGQQLMKHMLERFPDVRQKVLLTEEAPDVRSFYEKCGFKSADQGTTVAFWKLDN